MDFPINRGVTVQLLLHGVKLSLHLKKVQKQIPLTEQRRSDVYNVVEMKRNK